MNAGGSCDYCWCLPFFGFLRLDLSPWGYRIRCFLIALCCLTIRMPNLNVATKYASPSAGKNTMVVLVPCSRMEMHSYSYFRWCGYFWGPRVSFVMTEELSQTVILIVLLFYISFLTLVFALQWLSFPWEILIMLLSQFLLAFPGLSMNILHVSDKLPVQRGFFTNSEGDLLRALGLLGGLYNFSNFVIIFSLM